jgi:two-component system, response regulator
MEKKVILLIEDNPDDILLTQRAFIRSFLEKQINLVVAKDGLEALNYLYGSQTNIGNDKTMMPEIILLDLNLPKLNGLQILERIRNDKHTKLIPVVILTSSKEEADLTKAYKLGANSYIRKPVDFQKFKNAIQQLGLYWIGLNESPPAQ